LTRTLSSAYLGVMPKRSSMDENEIAAAVVAEATGQEMPREKNPAAVTLGRLGGQKGGRARAEVLSARKRKAIARKAAAARWKKRPKMHA